MQKLSYHRKKKVEGRITSKKIAIYVAKSVACVAVGTAAIGFIHGVYDGAVGNENKTTIKFSQNL